MGFFAEIVSEVRQGQGQPSAQQTAAVPLSPAVPATAPEASAARSAPAAPNIPEHQTVFPGQSQDRPAPAGSEPKPASGQTDPGPGPERTPSPTESAPPEVNLSVARDPDDAAKRKAHEAAEAKRKAEWDAKQAAREAARQEQLDRVAAMSDEDAAADAIRRIGADTERLTRRNMKEAVCEHIQALCKQDASFARRTMAPEKSMVNCFQYINRKAQEYAEQEMKDNGIKRTGVYGLDVPDGLCYQWAEDYFNDPDAKEDHKDDEKFIPKPYISTGRKATQGKAAKKESEKKKPVAEKPKDAGGSLEQMSLL